MAHNWVEPKFKRGEVVRSRHGHVGVVRSSWLSRGTLDAGFKYEVAWADDLGLLHREVAEYALEKCDAVTALAALEGRTG